MTRLALFCAAFTSSSIFVDVLIRGAPSDFLTFIVSAAGVIILIFIFAKE